MAGISNRPESVEDRNQQYVEARKDQLPDLEQVDKKDHPVAKDQEDDPASRGRVSETGAGRGLEHEGH
jgi:hypothetical protein